MIKTYSFFVLLFAAAVPCNLRAQDFWEVRILAGGGIGKMETDLHPTVSRGDRQVVDVRSSWILGGRVSHPVSGPLSLSIGVHWSHIAGHDEYWSQGKKIEEEDRQVHYLCLPMLVQVAFHRIHLGAGYQLALPLTGSGKFHSYPYANGYGRDVVYVAKDLGLKALDMGLVVEATYHFSDRIDAGVRYFHGVQDMKDHSDGILFPLLNRQLLLTVGYRILPRLGPKAGTKASPESEPAAEPVD